MSLILTGLLYFALGLVAQLSMSTIQYHDTSLEPD